MTINEMLEKRAKCVEDARNIFDKATDEKRDPTAEERQQFDALMKESDEIKAKVDEMQADEKRTAALADAQNELEASRGRQTQPNLQDKGKEVKNTFKFTDGREVVLDKATNAVDYQDAFNSYLRTGIVKNALQADSDPAGGYTSPAMFNAQLIQDIDDMTFIRQLATKFTLMTGESLGFPTLENDPADAAWSTELGSPSTDTTMDFGKREFSPKPLRKEILVSDKLIRSSAIGIDALVRNRLAYKFGISEEKAFLTGSGAGQPLGLFTASSDGISTGRDVSTGNTTTAFTADGLINAQYSLKGGYRSRADWLMHRDAIKMARKLKDGDGQYLWQPSLQADQPDMLLGRRLYESEYAPNTFTTGLYVGILGDFSQYWIVDSLAMSIKVLYELYARTNQVDYIGSLECDGMPVMETAFARVTLA